MSLKWRFLCALSNRRFAVQLAMLSLDGYLAEIGWTRSVRENAIVGGDGLPVPWATYPFIEFIGPRLCPDWTIFEYGAGASTHFYAARVARVIAVEHDDRFAAHLRPSLPANAELLTSPLGEGYVNAVRNLPIAPSIVCVDGRDRVACVHVAIGSLASNGVIILDDTERPEYAPACASLKEAQFKRLDFWGFSPGQVVRRCTSVFYRVENVLGL